MMGSPVKARSASKASRTSKLSAAERSELVSQVHREQEAQAKIKLAVKNASQRVLDRAKEVDIPVEDAVQLSSENYALERAVLVRRLLGLRNNLHDEDRLLAIAREKNERKAKELEEWTVRVKDNDLHLKKSMAKYEGYLQENDMKRARAETLFKQTVDENKESDGEIITLKDELKSREEELEAKKNTLEKLMEYSKFLEEVVDSHADFTEVSNLTGRAETLGATRSDLMEHKKELESEKEVTLKHITQFQEEATKRNILYSRKLAELEHQLERMMAQADQRSNVLSADRERLVLKATEWAQLRNATDFLYERSVSNSTTFKNPDLLEHKEKLDVVMEYFLDIRDITTDWRKEHQGALLSRMVGTAHAISQMTKAVERITSPSGATAHTRDTPSAMGTVTDHMSVASTTK